MNTGGGGAGQRGIKGEKWDNCNSIINKIYFKNSLFHSYIFPEPNQRSRVD